MFRANRLHKSILGRDRRRSLRPRLEGLEDRLVLSSPGDPSSIVFRTGYQYKQVMNAAGQMVPLQTPGPDGYSPAQIAAAYGLNAISFNGLKGDGTGQTIVIVDAYDNPSFVNSTDPSFASSALHIFDQQFGLPDPPSFTKLNQNGQTSPLPGTDPKGPGGWGGEIALDIEWAHAMAPGANIILVEANTPTTADLTQTASVTAARLGAIVSMSFGADEAGQELSIDGQYVVPNVMYLASTGDDGSPGGYPAFSPNVLAIGGTTLNLDATGTYPGTGSSGETGWTGSGGGTSAFETEPAFQRSVQNTGFRTIPDIAALADPNTGVAFYDPYDNGASTPWGVVGGTSLSSPLMAGMFAIIDQGRVHYGGQTFSTLEAQTNLYSLFATKNSDFHDIISGSNGGFTAGPGYDEVTGLGTPNGAKLVPDLASIGLFPNLQSITISPSAPSVAKGLTQQFIATGHLASGQTIDITGAVTWTSSKPTIASIDANGLATTVTVGSTVITASLQGISSAANTLTVTPAALLTISLTPVSPSLAKGLTQQFAALGTYTDGTTASLTNQVTWASDTPGVATITSRGFVQTLAVGTSNITATLGGVSSAPDPVTVLPAALVSIAITPLTPTVAKGLTLQFIATGTYTDNTTADVSSQVTWISSIRNVASINPNGLATAKQIGTTKVSAFLGSINTTAVSFVVTAPSLVSLVLTANTLNLAKGLSEKFTATGTYTDGTVTDLSSQVAWGSTSPAIASIDSTGLTKSLSVGTTNISATLNGLTTSPSTLTITPPALASISVSPNSPSLALGLSQQFTATGVYTDGSTSDLTNQVTWMSDAPVFATISATGLAPSLSTGATNITATLNGLSSGFDTMLVTDPALVSIAVGPANPTVAAGLKQQFTAMGIYSDGTQQDVTNQVTWSTGNGLVAHISTTGLASSSTIGGSTITATVGSVSKSTNLTVLSPALASIVINPGDTSIGKGLAFQYHADGVYTDGSHKDLTSSVAWSSSNSALAPITPGGLTGGAALGQLTISASFGGVTGNAALTVTPATVTSITIQPNVLSLPFGSKLQYHAVAIFTDGTTGNVDSQVTWSTSNSSLISISPNGLATSGSASGAAFIGAVLGDLKQTTSLVIGGNAPVLLSVSATKKKASISAVVLHFNEPLNAVSARNLAQYALFGAASPGGPYNVQLAIKSATYNKKNNTVTLTLKKTHVGPIRVSVLAGLIAANGDHAGQLDGPGLAQ